MDKADGAEEVVSERVWDAPTRLLKWVLAGCFAASWTYGFYMSFS